MVGKEHNARLSQPACWHRVWISRCAWQRPPRGPAGRPVVLRMWAASTAPAGLTRRRCWACCPPRAGEPPSPSLRGSAGFSAPAAGVVPVSEGRLQAASALPVPCSASAPDGPRVPVPGTAAGVWIGSSIRSRKAMAGQGAAGQSHGKLRGRWVLLGREQCGAGRKAEAGRARVGEAGVRRLRRGSPAAPGSHFSQAGLSLAGSPCSLVPLCLSSPSPAGAAEKLLI